MSWAASRRGLPPTPRATAARSPSLQGSPPLRACGFGSTCRPGRDCISRAARSRPGLPVTAGRSGVREALAGHRHEAPAVTLGVELQAQDAERAVTADPARALDLPDLLVVASAGARDELADAVCGVGVFARIQGGVALVEVRVGGQHHVAAPVVEGLPQRSQEGAD